MLKVARVDAVFASERVVTPDEEHRVHELTRYVRFADHDLAALRAFDVACGPHYVRIAKEFYERTREHAEAHAVFTGEEQIARLQRSLVQWMHRLCTGKRDSHYFRETQKIGHVHVKVGLPQRYVLAAMAQIRLSFEEVLDRELPAQRKEVSDALVKAMNLELAIMLESYQDNLIERVRRVDQLEREDLGRALARSERRYVNAVELAPYLVVGLDSSARVLLFNRLAERITGFARDEILGRPFVEVLIATELQEQQSSAVLAAVSGREGRKTLESAVRTKAGTERSIRWQIARADEGDDEVVAFAVGRDTTDQNALAERTRQAEKLAAVGTLAAGLAHEIRNPLNGAQLHVTFLERGLRRGNADPEALDALKVIASEIKRLSTLVNEFLDFARPKPLVRTPVVVQRLCEHVVGLVAGEAGAASVTVELQLPLADLVAELDEDKIGQVLLNLAKNGIEAMNRSGGGVLVLRARRQPFAVVIEIEDHGPGIANPSEPIFDAFYTTKSSGTGLGLAIVHRIVTDHGGTISFESRPGRTIFRTTLPLDSGSAIVPENP